MFRPQISLVLVAIALSWLNSGCSTVYSVHSLYSEADSTLGESLVGRWSAVDDGDNEQDSTRAMTRAAGAADSSHVIEFRNFDRGRLELIVHWAVDESGWQVEDRSTFRARQVRLGKHDFLDLLYESTRVGPRDSAVTVTPEFLPLHMLFRLAVTGDTLTLHQLEYVPDSLEWVRMGEEPPSYFAPGDRLITSSTSDLRRVVGECVTNSDSISFDSNAIRFVRSWGGQVMQSSAATGRRAAD